MFIPGVIPMKYNYIYIYIYYAIHFLYSVVTSRQIPDTRFLKQIYFLLPNKCSSFSFSPQCVALSSLSPCRSFVSFLNILHVETESN